MRINDCVKENHQNARDKGFCDVDLDPLAAHMLMVSELSEASQCVRNDEPPHYLKGGQDTPSGEAVELVDCILRIMTYFGERGWDLEQVIRMKMNYNKTRPFLHGKKRV